MQRTLTALRTRMGAPIRLLLMWLRKPSKHFEYHGTLIRAAGVQASLTPIVPSCYFCLVSLWIFLGFEASRRLCRILACPERRPHPSVL